MSGFVVNKFDLNRIFVQKILGLECRGIGREQGSQLCAVSVAGTPALGFPHQELPKGERVSQLVACFPQRANWYVWELFACKLHNYL